MTNESDLLVSTEWLASNLDRPNAVLIDAGEPLAYRRAHIAGAVGVPHPYLKGSDNSLLAMPPEEFEAFARAAGISNDTAVVIYDDNASLYAARVWWMFRLNGHRDVRIVDGGLNAWMDEGRPVTSAPARPKPGNFVAKRDPSVVVTVDELKAAVEGGHAPALWDTRTPEEWDGSNSRGHKRVGHVPGARHLEWRNLVQGPPARRFRPIGEIRAALEAAGIDPSAETVTYCEAGIRAAFGYFVLTLLGNDRVRAYDGSMGEWANRPDTPLTLD
jgi:thiosulfate/3-mercaptopyruvate sulfurtransferase